MASGREAAPTTPGRGVRGKPHPHQLQLPQLHVSIHPSTNRINGRLLQVNIQPTFNYQKLLQLKSNGICLRNVAILASCRFQCIRQVDFTSLKLYIHVQNVDSFHFSL